MLADPFVLNRDCTAWTASSALNFAASERSNDGSVYRALDGSGNDHKFSVRHQYGRTRNRYTMRYDLSGIVPNTLVPAENNIASMACYVVFDCPASGPVDFTGVTNGARLMICGIGNQLVGVSADSPFLARVIKLGET